MEWITDALLAVVVLLLFRLLQHNGANKISNAAWEMVDQLGTHLDAIGGEIESLRRTVEQQLQMDRHDGSDAVQSGGRELEAIGAKLRLAKSGVGSTPSLP